MGFQQVFGHFSTLSEKHPVSGGLVCLAFYKSNGYLVLAGWILISFPSVYYIVSNVWLASQFPAIGSLVVVTISATFDMSGGKFFFLGKT